MIRTTIVSAAVLAAASCTSSPETYDSERAQRPASEDRVLMKLVSDRLEKFEGEKEFLDYIRRSREIAWDRGEWWSGWQPKPPPTKAEAMAESYGNQDRVVVTASKRETTSEDAAMPVEVYTSEELEDQGSITNVQKIGVDEGDIVKRIGDYLVVLQDGRLFSIDMKPGGQPGLRLAARTDVYTRANDRAWYDEMLVTGNRVLVTAYDYGEGGTKLSVFQMGPDGRFTPEGAFVISSNDYYSTENYATRLVDGKLVIYSPLYLRSIDPDKPMKWPVVRRWRIDQQKPEAEGTRLFDARAIYQPMQPSLNPVVHTVSVCDLGSAADEANIPCRATAITAPAGHVLYVSPTDAFVWTQTSNSDRVWRDTCHDKAKLSFEDALPAGLYRVPLSGAKPTMMWTRGQPQDQFGIDTSGDEIRALVVWGRANCTTEDYWTEGRPQLKYFSAPLSMFRDDPRTAASYRFVDAPSPDGEAFENRFTDHYVVYGARDERWSYPPETDETGPRGSKVIALPVARPDKPATVTAPFGVLRAERVGDDMVLTGYRDADGLSLSYLDLSGTPRLASTTVLAGRYESENRSHAFNARVDRDGGGLVGVPTVERISESGRWWWRSDKSDLSYFTFNASGRLERVGELEGHENSQDPSYRCEVSCIDWYGNSRPFFISGRIYALMGTELVEGQLAEGKVIEVRRVNLTSPVR